MSRRPKREYTQQESRLEVINIQSRVMVMELERAGRWESYGIGSVYSWAEQDSSL